MKIIKGFQKAKEILSRQAPGETEPDARENVVRKIIEDVRRRGDAALFEYIRKFDGVSPVSLEVGKKQIKNSYRKVDAGVVAALKLAAKRIEAFHAAQKKSLGHGASLPGLSQLIRPLERVGVYVPGGTASYPSTVLMTGIPARVAGVKEVIVVTPPQSDGSVSPLVLAAADIAGIDRIFTVGGAQAIAALAFGTESIPRVDKICGPGNIFVTLAKKLVYGVVGIDGLAGPSEVLIIADDSANPAGCAADLLAQAEHDVLASAILITDSPRLAKEVKRELVRQLKALPRKTIVAESLTSRGIIAVVADMDEMIELSNLYAPEHLCLMVNQSASYIKRLTNAGCIIAGKKATVTMGDYIAGPSHVLPTGGTARFSSPLNVIDFLKLTNVINVDAASLKKLGPAAQILARAEGFEGHARAVEKRLGT